MSRMILLSELSCGLSCWLVGNDCDADITRGVICACGSKSEVFFCFWELDSGLIGGCQGSHGCVE